MTANTNAAISNAFATCFTPEQVGEWADYSAARILKNVKTPDNESLWALDALLCGSDEAAMDACAAYGVTPDECDALIKSAYNADHDFNTMTLIMRRIGATYTDAAVELQGTTSNAINAAWAASIDLDAVGSAIRSVWDKPVFRSVEYQVTVGIVAQLRIVSEQLLVLRSDFRAQYSDIQRALERVYGWTCAHVAHAMDFIAEGVQPTADEMDTLAWAVRDAATFGDMSTSSAFYDAGFAMACAVAKLARRAGK